ncbi:MAG: hypothetical protein M3H12_09810 [Chromatiales bacterium]|uniref:hypothetical protein n=1 Tax=endosymbiont of Lamellibrachia barhami TaxID=205975 RepID=UPI0015A92D0B|nr:hypothetical protein [endosymbiont of Lamellibrachia barhami]MBA1445364.1 hypothetical protein [Gammaproteobacteria bacterium]
MTKNTILRWVGVVVIVVPVVGVLAAGITYAESIQQLYVDFGAKLPYSSKIACEKYQWTTAFLTFLAPLFWVTGSNSPSKWTHGGVWAAILSLSVFAFWVALIGIGIYQPLFKAGQIT